MAGPGAAGQRILLRLRELQLQDNNPAREWKFTLDDSWNVKVFCALCVPRGASGA